MCANAFLCLRWWANMHLNQLYFDKLCYTAPRKKPYEPNETLICIRKHLIKLVWELRRFSRRIANIWNRKVSGFCATTSAGRQPGAIRLTRFPYRGPCQAVVNLWTEGDCNELGTNISQRACPPPPEQWETNNRRHSVLLGYPVKAQTTYINISNTLSKAR